MGYCYITGDKKTGRWVFVRCDGRSSLCPQHNPPTPLGEGRARNCVEFSKTYREAVEAVEDWEKLHKEDD